MDSKQKQWVFWQKSRLLLLVVAAVLVTAITGTLAWFSYIRKIQTVTLIDVPEIYIEGPQGEASELIELGDIDVTNGTSREYVFRIVTIPGNKYRLQFAHTTNVPFTYTIYPASKSGSGNSIVTGGEPFYYDANTRLVGAYLDTTDTHTVTYGNSANQIQKDAEPRYWQSETVTQVEKYSYYVLRVSWEVGLKNNKETDMVYMTVKIDES